MSCRTTYKLTSWRLYHVWSCTLMRWNYKIWEVIEEKLLLLILFTSSDVPFPYPACVLNSLLDPNSVRANGNSSTNSCILILRAFFICWTPHCLLHLGSLTSSSCSHFLHSTTLSRVPSLTLSLVILIFFFNLALFFSDHIAPLTSLSLLRSFFFPHRYLAFPFLFPFCLFLCRTAPGSPCALPLYL